VVKRKGLFDNAEYILLRTIIHLNSINLLNKMNSQNEAEIGNYLSLILSDKACASVILRIAGKVPIPSSYVDKAMEHLKNEKDFFSLARLALDVGRPERAIEAYLMEPAHPDLAAKIAEDSGDYKKGIEIWDSFGYPDRAISLAGRSNSPDLIKLGVQIAERNKRYLDGARLARKIGDEENSRILYTKEVESCIESKRYAEAVGIIEEAGINEPSPEILTQAGLELKIKKHYEEAAKLFAKAGSHDEARELYIKQIELFETERKFDDASVLADILGMKDRAEAYRAIQKLI